MKIPEFSKPKYFLIIVFLLAVFFSFWKLGSSNLREWDESEYGANSYEMLHNGDYVNYYYAGSQDTRNAKPPLLMWMVVCCYKIFGFNAFALRFSSAAASILFFIFAYKIIRLYKDDHFAFATCLILLSCKAIIGDHVGRTGDTDALLICFLTISLYYFSLYYDFDKRNSIFLFAIFSGLAFYAKGTAALILMPGLILYSFITGKWKVVLHDYKFWLAILIFFLISGSWIVLLFKYGNRFDPSTSFYKTKNAIETLFTSDTVKRLTDTSYDTNYKSDKIFFFRVLDTRLNIWNYFFYIICLFGIFSVFKNKDTFSNFFSDKLIVLSICLSFPVIIALTFATSTNNWYLAPIFIFIAIFIAKGMLDISRKYKWVSFLFVFILVFNLCRQFMELFFENHIADFGKSESVKFFAIPHQDLFLYLTWYGKKMETAVKKDDLVKFKKDQLIVFDLRNFERQSLEKVRVINCFENYCLAAKK